MTATTAAATTVVEVLDSAAVKFGGRPFLTTPDGDASFSEFRRRVAERASALRAVGVGGGDRVGILEPAGLRFLEAWVGTMEAGAVPVALNPASTQHEIEYVVSDTGAQWIVASSPAPGVEVPPGVRAINPEALSGPSAGPGGSHSRVANALPAPDDIASLVYTSGTSGRPKGVIVTHKAYAWGGAGFGEWINLEEDDHVWTFLPAHHINHQVYAFLAALTRGARLTITSKFHASTFWKDAAEIGATVTNLVGGMIHYLDASPERFRGRHQLRRIYAAPAGPPALRARFEREHATRLITGYAMSECFFGCIEHPGDEPVEYGIGRPRQLASAGWTNRVAIVDADGNELPPNEKGEIVISNPAVTPGYWGDADLTAMRIREGRLHTRDLGWRDESGRFYLLGRLDDTIRRKGENVAPLEVEDVLMQHPSVDEAAVLGVPRDGDEPAIVAFVVLARSMGSDDLRGWCAEKLLRFKVPDLYVPVRELPKTATLRVAKHLLREEAVRQVAAAR